MDSRHKHRLHSVDNLMQTRILGGEVSDKQMDAVYEEELEAGPHGAEWRGGTV